MFPWQTSSHLKWRALTSHNQRKPIHPASRMLAEAMESLTEEGITNIAARRNANVPRFKEFGDVIIAFAGGLTPLACADRPDRFADYTSFLMEVLLQHSTGRQHWPVLLHSIESVRKSRQPTGEGPSMDNIRERHKLCDYPLPSTRSTSVLDPNILSQSTNMFNDYGLRSTFIQDFVDPQVLQAVGRQRSPKPNVSTNSMPHPTATTRNRYRIQPYPTQTYRQLNNSRAQCPRLPHEDIALARQHKTCIKFLSGTCTTDPCPNNRPHELITSLRSRPRKTSTPTLHTTKKEGTTN